MTIKHFIGTEKAIKSKRVIDLVKAYEEYKDLVENVLEVKTFPNSNRKVWGNLR